MRAAIKILLTLLPAAIFAPTGVRASLPPDALFAANFEASPDCISFGTPGCPGFAFEIPASVASGTAGAYCYYFRTPNVSALGVGRFSSRLDSFAHHIVVWTTTDGTGAAADAYPPGTLQACGDGDGGNGTTIRRVYQANAATEQLRMPPDDGAGTAVALELPANTAGFVQMYFVNPGLDSVLSRVTFAANGLASGTAYTKTASYETYDGNISVGPFSSGVSTSTACDVPAAVKFWWFSTHTHHYATDASLSKGFTTILSSSNWEAPAIQSYTAPSFFTFGAGEKLTTQCTYANATNSTVTAGPDYALNENCVAVAYFFPADAPRLCYNGILF